jgi:putative Mg2+ transporter-C (MgtC) family protein
MTAVHPAAEAIARILHLGLLARLALAILLGGAIGVEREIKGKPAGLRTNILICIGATVFTYLSILIGSPGNADRIAASIITGVGFIGAGAILHTRGSVTGLTSAATIWVVSAIGMALGAGRYIEALGVTALVMVVLGGLTRAEDAIGRYSASSRIVLHVRPEPDPIDELRGLIAKTGLSIFRCDVRRENVDLVLDIEMRGPRRLHEQATLAMIHHPAVRSVSTGE